MAKPNDTDDFVIHLGLPLFAHRLRRASELLVEGAGAWLPSRAIEGPPRGVSTLLLLARDEPLAVTEIAARLRLSHPMVIKLLRALEAAGLVETGADTEDRRRRTATLTAKGRAQVERVRAANEIVAATYRALFDEIGIDLFAGIEALEAACATTSFSDRLKLQTDQQRERRHEIATDIDCGNLRRRAGVRDSVDQRRTGTAPGDAANAAAGRRGRSGIGGAGCEPPDPGR